MGSFWEGKTYIWKTASLLSGNHVFNGSGLRIFPKRYLWVSVGQSLRIIKSSETQTRAAACVLTPPTVPLWKEIDPFVNIVSAQETGSILKIGLASSKWALTYKGLCYGWMYVKVYKDLYISRFDKSSDFGELEEIT